MTTFPDMPYAGFLYCSIFIVLLSLVSGSAGACGTWIQSDLDSSGFQSPASGPPDSSSVPDSSGLSDSPSATDSLAVPEEESAPSLRSMPNTTFRVGERLVFSVEYGPVKAGTATLEVKEIAEVDGRQCYHLISEAKTNDLFSSFFEVQDRVESFMDVEGLFPWRFAKQLREGDYRSDVHVRYDQINRLAITDKDTMEVPLYVQDILSGFYYGRAQPLKKGNSLFIDHHSGKDIYPLEVKIIDRERIKVPAGVFTCIVIEPVLQTVGIFKHSGRLRVWLTDDERRIPVLMKGKMIIGSVVAKLVEFETGE